MKAILEFNLPDERMEFNRANQSLDMACALFDILQLRNTFERCFDDDEGNAYDGIAIMANGIAAILEKHNININNLIE